MHTILRSRTGVETIIGPDQPFVIIGERINPTGRKALAAEMLAGNFERVKADALAQVQAGATVLDVNAGLGVANAHELEPRGHGEGDRGGAVGGRRAAVHRLVGAWRADCRAEGRGRTPTDQLGDRRRRAAGEGAARWSPSTRSR